MFYCYFNDTILALIRIDEINFLQATMQAMRETIENLKQRPDMLLVDRNIKPLTSIPQESII